VHVNVRNLYLCCHTHLDTSVSRTWADSASGGSDNRWTCVHASAGRWGTGREREGGYAYAVVGRAESDESASFVWRITDRKKGEPRNVTHRNTIVNSATVSASL
jgi:hypothetical protein